MTDLTNNRVPLNPYDPAELLSSIPYQLKFRPAESLVALTAHLRSREVEIGFLARMDLEALFTPRVAARTRSTFVANLEHLDTCAGFLVVYSDELLTTLGSHALQKPGVEERATLITQELARWYDVEYFHPTRTYVVGHTRWRCLSCLDPGHCPPGGHPTSHFSHTSVAARMVARGKGFAQSREELIVLPPVPPPTAVNARVAEELRALHRLQSVPRPLKWKRRMSRKWEKLILELKEPEGRGELDGTELAVLALSLHDVTLRDGAIYGICTGNALPDPGTGTDADFAAMFEAGSDPNTEEITAALRILEAMAGSCPRGHRAPVLTVWAWCNWWVGNGAEANVLVDLALQQNRGYSLALTLRKVLNRSLLPPWVGRAGPGGA